MWRTAEITIEIEESDPPDVLAIITTPVGVVQLLGSVSVVERVLHIDRAHVGGLNPGALGRAGLNAIGRKLLEEADVDKIVIQGSTRTTGRNEGKVPRPICFPHR